MSGYDVWKSQIEQSRNPPPPLYYCPNCAPALTAHLAGQCQKCGKEHNPDDFVTICKLCGGDLGIISARFQSPYPRVLLDGFDLSGSTEDEYTRCLSCCLVRPLEMQYETPPLARFEIAGNGIVIYRGEYWAEVLSPSRQDYRNEVMVELESAPARAGKNKWVRYLWGNVYRYSDDWPAYIGESIGPISLNQAIFDAALLVHTFSSTCDST